MGYWGHLLLLLEKQSSRITSTRHISSYYILNGVYMHGGSRFISKCLLHYRLTHKII